MTVTLLNAEAILKGRTIEVMTVVRCYLNFVIICQMLAENIPRGAINFGRVAVSNFLYPATILSYYRFLNLG